MAVEKGSQATLGEKGHKVGAPQKPPYAQQISHVKLPRLAVNLRLWT